MRFFQPIFWTTALLSTAAVYYFAPLARPAMARMLAHRKTVESSCANDLRARLGSKGEEPIGPVSQAEEGVSLDVEPEISLMAAEQTAPAGISALSFERPPVPEVAQQEGPDRTAAELGINLVARGDLSPAWGIVCRRTEYFMMDGLSSGFLEVGKVIDYRATQYTSQGAMIEFMVDSPRGILTTPHLAAQANFLLFTGSYYDLSAHQLKELKTFYALDGAAVSSNRLQGCSAFVKGIQLVWRGDVQASWGVVRQQANRYRVDGRRYGLIESGTVVDFQKTVSSSKGLMVMCSLCATNGTPSERFLISQKDLHLFTGSYGALAKKQQRDLQLYYEYAGKITLRRGEMLQASAAKNPFFPAYQSSHQALMAHIDKSRVEVIRRDHLTGAEKVQAQEQMFALRMEERRLRTAYEEAQQKFVEWRKEHAGELKSPDNDCEIEAWTRQKLGFASSIGGLAF